MFSEKMDFFLHDVFMEIMSNMDSLEDYAETIDALAEGCLLTISADGETEEERVERLRIEEERRKQLKKELEQAEKDKEREAIERRIRLLDLIKEFMVLNGVSSVPGISIGLEAFMFVPLKAVTAAVRKRHPGKKDAEIEFDKEDRMLVKAELSRVRNRMENDGDSLKKDAHARREALRKERQEVLEHPARVKTL